MSNQISNRLSLIERIGGDNKEMRLRLLRAELEKYGPYEPIKDNRTYYLMECVKLTMYYGSKNPTEDQIKDHVDIIAEFYEKVSDIIGFDSEDYSRLWNDERHFISTAQSLPPEEYDYLFKLVMYRKIDGQIREIEEGLSGIPLSAEEKSFLIKRKDIEKEEGVSHFPSFY